MKHGRRAQQKRRMLRNKIAEHPKSEYSKEQLTGQTIEDLKEILEKFSLTEEEESSDVSLITPEQDTDKE